jgi:hypothetical protein
VETPKLLLLLLQKQLLLPVPPALRLPMYALSLLNLLVLLIS